MKIIENSIVFSNDIERILKGNNALDYNYEKKGMFLPSESFIEELRGDFKKDTNKVFDNKSFILSEEEMLESIDQAISDVIGRYPHCIFG